MLYTCLLRRLESVQRPSAGAIADVLQLDLSCLTRLVRAKNLAIALLLLTECHFLRTSEGQYCSVTFAAVGYVRVG